MASPQATPLAPARLFGLIGWLGYVPEDFKPPVSPLNSAQGTWRTWIPVWKKKRYAIAIEDAFWCIARPWRIIKARFWVFLLVGGIIRRHAYFCGPGIVFRLNACRLILVVHFKKITCPSTSTLKLKMMMMNLKNNLRGKSQAHKLKIHMMSLKTINSLI